MPVEVLGFSGTPEMPATGSRSSTREGQAREVSDYRARQKREKGLAGARHRQPRGSLEQMMSQLKTAGRKEFPINRQGRRAGLDRGDPRRAGQARHRGGRGARAPLRASAASPSPTSRSPRHRACRDHRLQRASAHKEAREAAERAGIEIRYYNIIYDLVDDVKTAMSGLLAPIAARDHARQRDLILEIFNVSKVGKIAGCRVTDGTVERGANCASDPRQRRSARRQAVAAQAVQGRRSKEVTAGQEMRHGVRELPGHAGRRRHRMLPRRDDPAPWTLVIFPSS